MLIHNHSFFRIYFGDIKDGIYPNDYLNLSQKEKIYDLEQFSRLKKLIKLDALVFLKQTHSVDGLVIKSLDQAKKIKCFSKEGDFLATNIKNVGIGIMTADCLPIIFFDKRNFAVAIAHAGWRGSVNKIAEKTVDSMRKSFGTEVEDLKIIFGPSAKSRCYKVSDDFVENLHDFVFWDRVIKRRSDGIYFDLPLFNIILLEGLGVKKEAISLLYNDCTICDIHFFSYRRDGEATGRQMTVVCLA